jgi:hypothetical protein
MPDRPIVSRSPMPARRGGAVGQTTNPTSAAPRHEQGDAHPYEGLGVAAVQPQPRRARREQVEGHVGEAEEHHEPRHVTGEVLHGVLDVEVRGVLHGVEPAPASVSDIVLGPRSRGASVLGVRWWHRRWRPTPYSAGGRHRSGSLRRRRLG